MSILARKAHTSLTMSTTVDNVHVHDIITGKRNGLLTGVRWLVTDVKRHNLRRTLQVQSLENVHEFRATTYDMTHEVEVQIEHECHCGGTGVHYGHGHVENGVFRGTVSVCYGCKGKGWQTRQDVIRNHTYWSKFARV